MFDVSSLIFILFLQYVVGRSQFYNKNQLIEGRLLTTVGRFDEDLRCDWSASTMLVNVIATRKSVGVEFNFSSCVNGCKIRLEHFVNCVSVGDSIVVGSQDNSNQIVTITFPASINTSYNVHVTKLSEASCGDAEGVLQLSSVNVIGGHLTESSIETSCLARSKRVLFIGDSITAAYGVEGVYPCSFSIETENVLKSYAHRVADAINATAQIIAWSGKGVVRNYGDPQQLSLQPMPMLYNRTIGNIMNSYWNPLQFTPHLVMIMLGTNDYSTQPVPSDNQFISGLNAFVSAVQHDYPSAQLLLACAPMNNGNQCRNIELVATSTHTKSVAFVGIPNSVLDDGDTYGCDYHPSQQQQQSIANYIIPVISKLLK